MPAYIASCYKQINLHSPSTAGLVCESELGPVPRLQTAQLYPLLGLAPAMRMVFVCKLLFEDSHARWQCCMMKSGGQAIPHYFCLLSYDIYIACRKVIPVLIK